jgi:hypothetical protein
MRLDGLLLVATLASAPGAVFAQTTAPSPDPLAPVRSMAGPRWFASSTTGWSSRSASPQACPTRR